MFNLQGPPPTFKTRINKKTGKMETFADAPAEEQQAKLRQLRKETLDRISGNDAFHDDPNAAPKPEPEAPAQDEQTSDWPMFDPEGYATGLRPEAQAQKNQEADALLKAVGLAPTPPWLKNYVIKKGDSLHVNLPVPYVRRATYYDRFIPVFSDSDPAPCACFVCRYLGRRFSELALNRQVQDGVPVALDARGREQAQRDGADRLAEAWYQHWGYAGRVPRDPSDR